MSDSRWITRMSAADHQDIRTLTGASDPEVRTSFQSGPRRRYVVQCRRLSDTRWQTSGSTKPIALMLAPTEARGGATEVLSQSRSWPLQRATTAVILVAS